MADSVRIVTFRDSGEITELGVLQSSLGFEVTNSGFERDTLAILRGDRNQQMIKRGGRYDGEQFGGERVSNSSYKFTILLAGASPDALLTKIAEFLALTEKTPGDHYIEHKADGCTYPSYYEIRAPAKVQEKQSWVQQRGAGSMAIDVEWPVAPLACGAPMDVLDANVAAHLDAYTFGSSSALGFPTSAGALTTERRLMHTERGYKSGNQQVTISAKPGPTINGFKVGAVVKHGPVDDPYPQYVEVYVDDNGTNSRLRIDTVIGAVRTNQFTTNLGTRISSGTTIYIRGRQEGGVIYAEYFTSTPTPMGTPVSSGSWNGFGSWGGVSGISWIPQHASATVPTFRVQHYVYRNVTTPWSLANSSSLFSLPGTAPARGGVCITTSGGASPPVFGLFSWLGTGACEAFNGGGFSTEADADARGGSLQEAATVAAGNHVYFMPTDLSWSDLNAAAAEGAAEVEVWARVRIASGQTVRLAASVERGVLGAATLTTREYGLAGKTLIGPSSGTVYRFVRLGTILFARDAVPIAATGFKLTVVSVSGTPGLFGVDYGIVTVAGKRALMPSAKPAGSTYPALASSTSEVVRRFAEDLRGYAGPADHPAAGMTGAPILFDPSNNGKCISLKLSNLVPDDPTVNTSTEQLAHSATVQVGPIIPRYHYQRND